MRWIWIDRVTELEHGRSARAVKNLALAEDYFADHFPGYPVMPGSLILEGLAQTGGILVGEANDFREKVVLAKIPSARFHRDVLAGQTLVYETEIVHLRPEGASVAGRAFADGDLAVEAEIFFAHLDRTRAGRLFGDHNFVFSGELKYLLEQARAIKGNGPAQVATPAPVSRAGAAAD